MDILVIVGLILAFINPVIGGVLVGYLVWLNEPVVGLQLIVLSLTITMSIYNYDEYLRNRLHGLGR